MLRNIRSGHSESAYSEPVIYIRSPETIRDRMFPKKHSRHHKSKSTSNFEPFASVVLDKRMRDLKLDSVIDARHSEPNKYHQKLSQNCENSAVRETTTQNNLLTHDPDTYKCEVPSMSTWVPNIGHPDSHGHRLQSNQMFPTKYGEPDQYLSDESQEIQLFPGTVYSMPCSPRVNTLHQDQFNNNSSFSNSEYFNEKYFGQICQPNTNVNAYEFYESQLNQQLTKLSRLHAQQLNIQVLLEREWVKLHKLNSLKMSQYGYNDIKRSGNYDIPQFPLYENLNNPRYVRQPNNTEMNYMNLFKNHTNRQNYLNKNFKSAECGLNKLDTIADNQTYTTDPYNTVLTSMNEINRNSVAEETFEFNSNYHMVSPNNKSKLKKPGRSLNLTLLHGKDHLHSQEPLNYTMQDSASDGYSNYPQILNELLPNKLMNTNNFHLSESNDHNIIKKPSIPILKNHHLDSSENERHLTIQCQSLQPNQHSEKSRLRTTNYQNSTRITPDKQNYRLLKLKNSSSPDRLSSKAYLKPDHQKNFLINQDYSRLPLHGSISPPQIFKLRKSMSQPCIYDEAVNIKETIRSNFQRKNSPTKQNSELNIVRSSTESLDGEILDIDHKATSSWLNDVNSHNLSDVNDVQHYLQDNSQLTYQSRIIRHVDKLPRHVEVDKEKDYECSSNSTSHSSLPSSITNKKVKIQKKSMQICQSTENKLKVTPTIKNISDVKKQMYKHDETSFSIMRMQNNVESNHCKSQFCDENSLNLSTVQLLNTAVNQQDRSINDNCTIAATVTINSNNTNLNKENNHFSDDRLHNNELDLTNDSGISSVNKDLTLPSGVIYLRKEIIHVVFGPLQNSPGNTSLNLINTERPDVPTWLAICTDEMSVFVYDLWTLSCLAEFMNHTISSTSPVIHLFPLNPSENFEIYEKTQHNGFLCVVQKNGILTLYNIATCNMISRTILDCEICCASLIPSQGKPGQYLPEAIFSIDTSGSLTVSQWKIIKSNNHTLFNGPTLCDETLEIGTNIFNEISRRGKHGVFKYCTYIQDNFRSLSSESKLHKTTTNSATNKTLRYVSSDTNLCEFSFITAAYECTKRKILRLTSWICKRKGLRNTVSYNKILSNDPNSNLIDISVDESGCSGSLCMCFTNEIFWLSLHSFDILSKFKLPTYMQPMHCLSKSWPQPADLNQLQNRRTWICVDKNRVLEISPFESQRRLDTRGRACLLVCPVSSTDSQVATISTGLGIRPIIATALQNGEVHIARVPESCFSCMVEFCSLGFTSKEKLVHHVVKDHYLSESTDGFRCSWASCDLYLPLNCAQFNEEV
ncbi:zinc finger domain [Schistosoma japonicum]|nr:zinc finger domain [Schistosoma japonicum]